MNESQTDWLNKAHNAMRTLRQNADELEFLADAFAITGNERVANKLYRISSSIYASSDNIGKATSQASKELLRIAESGAFSTVHMALAMAKMEKEK